MGQSTDEPQSSVFRTVLQYVEQTRILDPIIRTAEPAAARLVANPRVRALLRGDATGTPLHPIATDVPFGAFFMAQFLDLSSDPGMRRAATRLVGLGVVAAAPTALTGWSEWARADEGTRRVGIIHAGANALGTLIFLGSWLARRREDHELGVRLARIGGAVLIVGGFTGGYMSSRVRR